MIANIYNKMGKPKFVYRVDIKSPEIVFKQGFVPWGTNQDWFSHILGVSQDPHSPKQFRTNYISTTSSIDVALRIYLGMLNNKTTSDKEPKYYLYEIRADENFYSTRMTASKGIGLIRDENSKKNLKPELYNLINYSLDACLMDYSWQKEYLAKGYIEPQNIKSATLLSHFDIDPDLVKYKNDDTQIYKHAFLNSNPILNPFYVEKESFAANKPLDIKLPSEMPSELFKPTEVSEKLNINGLGDNLLEVDSYWGTRSSMGMMCPTPQLNNLPTDKSSPNHSSDLPEGYEQFSYCYIGNTLTPSSAPNYSEHFNEVTGKIGVPLQETEVYFESAENGLKFFACEQDYQGQIYIGINGEKSKPKQPIKIYLDTFGRLVWNRDKNQFYALTPKKWVFSSDKSLMCLTSRLQAINEEEQTWHFQLVKIQYSQQNPLKPEKYLFRLVNTKYPNYVLCINKEAPSNFIWMTPVDHLAHDLEEIYVAISPSETDASILMTQKPTTVLANIDLKWYLYGVPYIPNPTSNTSYENHNKTYQFYYCLKTQNIYYYSFDESKFFALKNERRLDKYIGWPRWAEVEFGSKYYHTGYKWYFVQPRRHDIDDYNYREIRSYLYNDYLKTPPTGLDWGSLYTNSNPNENNSIKVFVIDTKSDI